MNNGRWRSFSTPRVTRSRAPRALGVRYPRGGVRLLGLSYLLARLRLVEEVPVALDPLPSVRASRHYFGVAPTPLPPPLKGVGAEWEYEKSGSRRTRKVGATFFLQICFFAFLGGRITPTLVYS